MGNVRDEGENGETNWETNTRKPRVNHE